MKEKIEKFIAVGKKKKRKKKRELKYRFFWWRIFFSHAAFTFHVAP